jgi:formate dehydrogenase maturation protein FdhE
MQQRLRNLRGRPARKYCPACREWLPVGEFAMDRSRNDGRYPTCRVCRKERRMNR